MKSYLFSIKPETYGKVSPLLESLEDIRKERENVQRMEEGTELVRKEQKIMDEVEEILVAAGEKKVNLRSIEGVLDEGDMVLDFTRFFRKMDPTMIQTVTNPANPAMIKEYWGKLSLHLEKKETRKDAIGYCQKEEDEAGHKCDPKMVSKVFDNWVSLIEHAAKNGNWYYHMVLI